MPGRRRGLEDLVLRLDFLEIELQDLIFACDGRRGLLELGDLFLEFFDVTLFALAECSLPMG